MDSVVALDRVCADVFLLRRHCHQHAHQQFGLVGQAGTCCKWTHVTSFVIVVIYVYVANTMPESLMSC